MNTQRRRRLLKYGPSVYVVKCRFSMNSLSVPFERRSLWTAPYVKEFQLDIIINYIKEILGIKDVLFSVQA